MEQLLLTVQLMNGAYNSHYVCKPNGDTEHKLLDCKRSVACSINNLSTSLKLE